MENADKKIPTPRKTAKMTIKAKKPRKRTAKKSDFDTDGRKRALLGCFADADPSIKTIVTPLIAEMVYMEANLERIKGVPLLLINKNDPTKQQQTPAAQLYSRLMSRYADVVAKLTRMLRVEDTTEESPLRAYMRTLDE
jgi:hypothetical protein